MDDLLGQSFQWTYSWNSRPATTLAAQKAFTSPSGKWMYNEIPTITRFNIDSHEYDASFNPALLMSWGNTNTAYAAPSYIHSGVSSSCIVTSGNYIYIITLRPYTAISTSLVEGTIRRININYLTTDASGIDAAEIICKNNTSSDMAHWTEYIADGATTWPTDFDYSYQLGNLKAGIQVYNGETYLRILGQSESSSEGYYRNFNATTFTWGTRYRDPSGISQYQGGQNPINNIQDGRISTGK